MGGGHMGHGELVMSGQLGETSHSQLGDKCLYLPRYLKGPGFLILILLIIWDSEWKSPFASKSIYVHYLRIKTIASVLRGKLLKSSFAFRMKRTVCKVWAHRINFLTKILTLIAPSLGSGPESYFAVSFYQTKIFSRVHTLVAATRWLFHK